MITTNVLQRVFQIKVGVALGTGFSIDVKGKQYLVTASHVVGALSGTTEIELFHDGQWKSLGVTVIGRYNPDEIDVAVLGPHKPLTHPKFAMEPSCGVAYGQDVYFLGFPYGLAGNLGEINRNFPAPFVKKAVVSCLPAGFSGAQVFYLDGHNNPGFSGGPVVFTEPGQTEFKVAGLISGYRQEMNPVYEGDAPTSLQHGSNTGIVICYMIKHALDAIHLSPAGYDLSKV